MDRVFITGFPGLIANQLVARLLQRDVQVNCLVARDQLDEANKQADKLCNHSGADRQQLILHAGDITMQHLGMGMKVWRSLAEQTDYVFHTQALSDLSASRHLAEQIHVLGSDMVSSFCLECRQLKRYVFFSTADVCGSHRGEFREDQLELDQNFYNHHQRTRHFAEVRVQSLAGQLPLTVLRPSIVVGDPESGIVFETDGLYHLMDFVWRFRRMPLPRLGNTRVSFNLVPVDYVAEAALFLAASGSAVDSVFHLADPRPRTVEEIYSRLTRIIAGKKPSGRLPLWLLSPLLRLPPVARATGLDRQKLICHQQYMNLSTSKTREALAGTGIVCPDIMSVVPVLAGRFLASRQVTAKGVDGQ